MYSSFQLAKKYLQYYLAAQNGKGHGMHSPFVFDFILHVVNNKSGFTPPASVESLRSSLLRDKRTLTIQDFGAGSRTTASTQRTVQAIAKSALKQKKYAQLLFRCIRHYKPQHVLELGTSLGITTSYLALANPLAQVLTVEGSEDIAATARETFHQLGLKNIRQQVGNFDVLLPQILNEQSSFDFVYIDGNHRYEPTVRYFQQLLPAVHNDTILVFDDIHWSEEMERAWQEIQQHPAVRCTVDLFALGFVFFRSEFRTRQHFAIRF